MLNKLQTKWKVSAVNLFLIIATFAIGGSLCGYAGRKLLGLTNIEKGVIWVLFYVVTISILWPIAVILVSIPLGQFCFFKRYIRNIFNKMSGKTKFDSEKNSNNLQMKIALFASGGGSNAEVIIKTLPFLLNKKAAIVAVIVSNNETAGVKNIAAINNIPFENISLKSKTAEQQVAAYFDILEKYNIGFIVLAGYLKKLPKEITMAFSKKIVNIHPALLPAYGGAGMYGKHVHKAVIDAGEKESGITIHYVDEVYDHGQIIFQAKCNIEETDTADHLAKKILAMEHQYYSSVIAETIVSQNPVK